jgi:two-component system, sensor histidine kinase and response regulator
MTVNTDVTPPADDASALSQALSILLVEDSPPNRKIITGLLRKRGHRVAFAESGREALKRYFGGRFDAVLMDIEMPAMNGYQTAAAIRRKERASNSHTPIIALTAHVPGADSQEWLKVGMDAFMTKPIDVDLLISLIKNIVQSAHKCGEIAIEHDPANKDKTNSDHPNLVIDYAASMRRLDYDMELFKNIIEIFNEDSPKLLHAIDSAIVKRDSAAIKRAAHALRGLAANFDAKNLADTARRLEHATHDELFQRDAALPASITDQVKQVKDALAGYQQS